MQVQAHQLDQHLQDKLQGVYLVFGDDPFLLNQTLDRIRSAAKAQGFEERQRFTQDRDFAWESLQTAGQTMSLFTSQQLIELELPDAKPGREGGQALQDFLAQQSPDQILLVFGPRLRKDQQKTKWFQALSQAGMFVPLYTPDRNQLPNFIKERAAHYQLVISGAAIEQLCDWYEGNLLALDQSLMRLSLTHADGEIGVEQIRLQNHDNSRFDIFALRDAVLHQHHKEYVHCLQRLMETGTEPTLILWTLQKLHQALLAIQQAQQRQQPLQTIWNQEQIWSSQQQLYLGLAKQQTPELIGRRLHLLERLERSIKRDSGESVFLLALHIGFAFRADTIEAQLAPFAKTVVTN
ncbi:DNA polymerase III subunit delta [Aliidiomarina halalkaliphila]|uniref:DNA polymerase III subunit delta n=1 Tax=Aliidiomarina halalkaliphila TaxID=2593535 RepID=A0A552X310_9GAMM|nr:DNA polymerase III subunit delta [Aliidiomarina halalkaliphila]TRW49418.1 DNA polymerase III subunit delta [Aliidiomarina halalkaliphila]